MEQGPTEKTILEQCYRHGMPIPEKIQNAPSLAMGLELYYLGFQVLSTCRSPGGMSLGPIMWLAIQEYCDRYDIQGEDREDFEYLISSMDSAYRTYIVDQAKSEADKPAHRRASRKRGQ